MARLLAALAAALLLTTSPTFAKRHHHHHKHSCASYGKACYAKRHAKRVHKHVVKRHKHVVRIVVKKPPPKVDVDANRAIGVMYAPIPEPKNRTAIYSIADRVVYLPDGRKLEAHSGLGAHKDRPQYVGLRNRGPTPPNEYRLVMRGMFHGVLALRMIPSDLSKMRGRNGILAHSYLGRNGQSHGCMSVRNYAIFLRAFLRGEINKIIVVPRTV